MHKIILLMSLLFTVPAFAGNCDNFYPKSIQIKQVDTQELCNSFFVAVYSLKHKGPLFTSAIITPAQPPVERAFSFKPDLRIPLEFRNTVKDFEKSGYDRGHMVAAADTDSSSEMEETFKLSNIAPQNPSLNRGPWKKIENDIRLSLRENTYVITGAHYSPTGTKIGNNVHVPVAFFKIVYYKSGPIILWAENKQDANIEKLTQEELLKRTKINYFRQRKS